ncbi:hypothetical protein HanRHA438_Chr05g0244811 [Helianthus annuus]|nr:hypothetical protein HanRHA438_Chr05g0244811 [Helianthus annuus]
MLHATMFHSGTFLAKTKMSTLLGYKSTTWIGQPVKARGDLCKSPNDQIVNFQLY